MTKLNEVYKCAVCGNIVTVLHAGAGQLVCCGKPMDLLVEKMKDIGLEKHQPLIDKKEGKITVKVGAMPHPMEPGHFIEWIELNADGTLLRKMLKPGEKPEAVFEIRAERVSARIYCNIHGLWKSI